MFKPEEKNVGRPGPSELGNIIYEAENYTGSQILVMMGDVLIDDAVAIMFQVSQNRVPVFGWASQYYSFVAGGQVFVNGAITVAFKEAAYLLYPAQRYNNLAGMSRSPRHNTDGSRPPMSGDLRAMSAAARHGKTLYPNVEQMMATGGSVSKGDAGAASKEYIDQMRALSTLPDKDFENYAEAFEDVVWYGAEKANPEGRDQFFSKNLPGDDTIENDDVFTHRRLDQYPPVDILVIYGDPNQEAVNHTVMRLMDVSFTQQVQTIEANGEPIYSVHQFIARNVV